MMPRSVPHEAAASVSSEVASSTRDGTAPGDHPYLTAGRGISVSIPPGVGHVPQVDGECSPPSA